MRGKFVATVNSNTLSNLFFASDFAHVDFTYDLGFYLKVALHIHQAVVLLLDIRNLSIAETSDIG